MRKMLLLQLGMLVCWLCEVIIRQGIDGMLERLYSCLVRSMARAEEEACCHYEDIEGENLKKSF